MPDGPRRNHESHVRKERRSLTILLKECAAAIPDAVLYGDTTFDISGLEYNSRLIKPGYLFVAIKGFKQDGNQYIADALAHGAVAVVTETRQDNPVPQIIVRDARAALADLAAGFYHYQPGDIKLCCVTGTNGKTTTCFLTRNIMAARNKSTGLITSLVYDTGSEKIPADRTTPESLDIYRLLHLMKKNFCVNAVIEVSSHALVLHRVKNLNVQVAVYTSFSRDHLDFHRDMEDYLEAKAKLLDMVADPSKWAVINYDCPEFRGLLKRVQCGYMTYSLDDRAADIHLENYHLDPSGSTFDLCTPMGKRSVKFKLPGRYNLYNALAAAGAALASGIDIDTVVTGLEKSTVIPGRLERVESSAPFTVFVDFAHTPDGLKRTIEAVREFTRGRILTLFGCGGDRDRGKRPLMGEMVTSLSDFALLTSDNPRTEDPLKIIEDVKAGLKPGVPVEVIPDRRQAIAAVFKKAREHDVVILAGKGAEEYQEIQGVKHPFRDMVVAQEELHKLGY
jgi:UDP-N-acetylmuramoyl-L-alanyl-D-glutamate--2,6-diaminopimelate ligase